MPPPPLLGMALVGLCLGGMMFGLRGLRNRVHPELLRKCLHVGMGLITLSFPWLFADRWPVVVLGVLASVLMLVIRQSAVIRSRIGGVVDGVERQEKSLGEVYFPVAVAGLFYLAHGDPVAYCVPLLLLALGDAVAALIGVRYGRLYFTTDDGRKSWEGSIAFFVVAFLSVHIPLLLSSDATRLQSLLIGLIMGLLVMLLEAIAWRGLDNLFIPLGGFLLLQTFRQQDEAALTVRLIVTIFLVVFALTWRQRTTLNHGAALGAALIGFLAWAVGGWRWLLPPLSLFSLYALLFPFISDAIKRESHDIHDVLNATGIGLLWLFIAAILDRPALLLSYTVAYAAHLAIIGTIHYDSQRGRTRGRSLAFAAILQGAAALFIPFVLLEMLGRTFPINALPVALGLSVIGVCLAVLTESVCLNKLDIRDIRRVWLRQVAVFVGSALPALYLAEGGLRG
jgi:phytol kinase